MPSSRPLSPGWSRISATFFGCVTSMPDITNYTSSFPGWSFPAAMISTLVLRVGKKISTCSATSSTTENSGQPNLVCVMNALDDADGWADLFDTVQN